MLNAGMETNDINGLCFNFFVEVEALSIHDSYIHNHNDTHTTGHSRQDAHVYDAEKWWDYEMCSPKHTHSGPRHSHTHSQPPIARKKVWTAVTVCLLFRDAFLQPLTKCMHYTYTHYILPTIKQWEAARKVYIDSYVTSHAHGHTDTSTQQHTQLLLPATIDAQKLDLLKRFPSCHLDIDKMLSFLFMECPLPIPNILSVTLQFGREGATHTQSADQMPLSYSPLSPPSSSAHTPSYTSPSSRFEVHFSLGSIEKLPVCPLSIHTVLQMFGARCMVDIFCCVLTECRMVFHSVDIGKLHTVCEVFRTLIYPLKWTHVYLPVVPIHLLNLIEAPVPYLLGTHTDWLQFIHLDYLQDVVLVDCDSGAMEHNNVGSVVRLPEKEDRWLVSALARLRVPGCVYDEDFTPHRDHSKNTPEHTPTYAHTHAHARGTHIPALDDIDTLDIDLKIQLLFYDVLFHLLRYISECLFYLNPSCPVFNRPLFLSEYTTEEYQDTLELLTATNSFHELTETLHTPTLKFFYDCIEYYAELERKIISSTDEQVGTGDVGDSSPNKKQESNKRTLARNVSVASIIFDKIAFSSPPPTEMSTIKEDSSSPWTADKPPNRAQILTKQMSGSLGSPRAGGGRTSGRAINRTVSFLGPNNTPNADEFSPLRPRALLASTGQSALNNYVLPEPTAYKDESLCLSYPAWIFNSESHSDVLPPTQLKVYETIKLRLKQYIKISNATSSAVNHNASMRGLTIRIVNSSYEAVSKSGNRLETLYDLKLSVDREQDEVANPSMSSYSLDYYGVESTLHHGSSDEELSDNNPSRAAMLITRKKSFSDSVSPNPVSACPFITFDPQKVLASQQAAKEWTIEELAKHFGVHVHNLLDKLHKYSYTLQAKQPGHRQSMALGKASQRSIATAAKNANTAVQKLSNTVNVDDCLIQFLQQVMTTSHVDQASIESSIKGKVHKALEQLNNRQGLITVLKSAKNDDKKGSKKRQAAVNNVYPLNHSAFEAFIALFYEFLSICSQQKDYLNAYGLLELGGQYFRMLPVELQVSLDEEDEKDIIEFLSEKTCMHPIYQTTALWKAILQDRIPADNIITLNINNPTASTSKPLKSALKSEAKSYTMKDLKNEIQSLLYIMLGLGVNSARALEFIRAVASDYRMGIDEFYKLQRFTNSLWASSEPTQANNPQTVGDNPSNPSNPTVLSTEEPPASINRKPSRDSVAFPQRRNTGINDIMAKQGHVDKMLTSRSRDVGSFYGEESVYNITNNPSFNWGKMDEPGTVERTPSMSPMGRLSNKSVSFRVMTNPNTSQRPKRTHSDKGLLTRGRSDMDVFLGNARVDSTDDGEGLEVYTLQAWDDNTLNAMLGSTSTKPPVEKEDDKEACEDEGAKTPVSITDRIKHDNQYEEHFILDLPPNLLASSISSLNSYMLLGCQDGSVHVVDTDSMTSIAKVKHSNAAGDKYQGVTKINTLSAAVPNAEDMFFTSCSAGIIKTWTLPQDSSKMVRNKQAVAVIKHHAAPITCMASQVLHSSGGSAYSSSMNWLLVSADTKGEVFITKGDHSSQQYVSASAALRAAYSVNTHVPFSSQVSSSNAFLGSSDPAVTALCLVNNTGNYHGMESRRMSVARPVTPAAVNQPDSYWLCMGTGGGLVGVVDMTTASPVFLVEGHSARVSKIMQIKAHEFISAGYDRCIKLWDIRVRNKTASLKAYDERTLGPNTKRCGCGPVTDIAVGGQDNTLVISTTADGVIKLWDLRYDVHAPCSEIRAHRQRISQVLWTDRAAFHTASYDGTVRSWDSIHGSNIRFVPAFDSEGVECMAMTQCSYDGAVQTEGGLRLYPSKNDRTCVAALSWTGAVKMFSYRSPGME
ncbi:hypothetical protein EON65_18900 [archaeon]|nr:MAG: hypothetical protein EON65_18900 [archaeon]